MDDILAIEGGKPVSPKYIIFGKPTLGQEEEDAVIETMRSQWIGNGQKTIEFENAFANYVGSDWAFSVSSCTAALHLSLLACGIKPGDEVITTPLTFVATINAIEYVGAKPILAEIQEDTLNIDPEKIREKITPLTKAILPVHFSGMPVDMEEIESIAGQQDLDVIYDAAHAIGAISNKRRIGSGPYLSCFSFYPNKNITTCEGGMITGQRNDKLLEKLTIYRHHGLCSDAWQRYQYKRMLDTDMYSLGYKYNMTDLQASLGLVQLKKLESFQQKRLEIAEYYNKRLATIDHLSVCYHPEQYPHIRHALHLYVVLLDIDKFRVDRNQIVYALRGENIGVSIHYTPIFEYQYYLHKYKYSPQNYPITNRIARSCITLPINPSMTIEDAELVVLALKKVLKWYAK